MLLQPEQPAGMEKLPDVRPRSILTTREIEVLKLVAEGLTTKEIGTRLGVSFKTAACHRQHLMAKLNIRNVVGLVRYAIRNKFVEP